MKGIKISLLVLSIATILNFVGVNATTTRSYAGINLKAYSGTTHKGPATKKASGVQKYKNEYNINLCTSNYNDVSVRVYSEAKGYSEWAVIKKGFTVEWPNDGKTNRADAYDLYIKNNVWGLCESQHFGTWYLDV